ncbi:MAG: hypothetical protein ACI853_001441 [Paracoccaceae bacterium]
MAGTIQAALAQRSGAAVGLDSNRAGAGRRGTRGVSHKRQQGRRHAPVRSGIARFPWGYGPEKPCARKSVRPTTSAADNKCGCTEKAEYRAKGAAAPDFICYVGVFHVVRKKLFINADAVGDRAQVLRRRLKPAAHHAGGKRKRGPLLFGAQVSIGGHDECRFRQG